jgi:hypothetical protein
MDNSHHPLEAPIQMANTKRQSRPKPMRALPAHVQRVAGPRTRLSALFQLLEETYEHGDGEVFALRVPEDEDEARRLRLDAGFLVRAINAMKAVELLCDQAHWEFAVSAVRQLFEIVVNVEYMNAQLDRAAAEFRFAKYGLLQMVLDQHGTLEYDERTGRQIDQQRRDVLERMLESSFPEFRSVGPTGVVHWAKSWSGHTTRRLAELSPQRLRLDQHRRLNSAWSEQSHATPSVFLESVVGRHQLTDVVVANDDTRIAETISVAISLYIELRRLLPCLPASDLGLQLDWTRRLIEEAQRHGAPSPAPFVGDPARRE